MAESESKHASVKLYWVFAAVLCVVTFFEWILFHIDSIRANSLILVPTLVVLSIVKFVMVCGWYMHLRYDDSILRRVFGFALVLVIIVFTILFLAL